MKFLNKFFYLLLLFTQLNNNLLFADANDTGIVVASAAAGAGAGFGIYQLFTSFCSTSYSLVDESCKELMKAKNYTKQLEILEKEYEGLIHIDKKQEIMSINEDLADQLSTAVISKRIDDNFVYDLKKNIKNLKYYQTKLPKRIRKLLREKNQAKYTPIIKDMEELVKRINTLVPKLDDLNSYVDNHRKYFELENVINQFTVKYRNELKIVDEKKIHISQLKRALREKYLHTSYPLMDAVKFIKSDLETIEKYASKAVRYEDIYDDASDLKKKIYKIKDIIYSDSDYFTEKRAYENAQALNATAAVIGAAAGVACAVANSNKPKVVYVEEEVYEPQYEIVEDYIIEE